MIDSIGAMEADLEYAERMVRKGFGTAEQAAETCGVSLAELQARLAEPPRPEALPKPSWGRFLA